MAEGYKYPKSNNFKFRELKVYASTEWLADNKKKYRQVFDRFEITYVYAELSFFNKLFDAEDWEIDIELKCFSLKKGRKELCSLPFKRKVSKYDPMVYIREGWGNKKEGVFWKKGTYYWEAWVEGEKVATKYFYVEDAGTDDMLGGNGYLSVHSLKLYEGPYDDVNEDDRKYLHTFSSEETRYIYVEILLKNEHPEKNWQCELFSKLYNNARELKGQVVRLQRVEKKDEFIKMTAGWGSNVKGSWRRDQYTAELVFMDKMLATIPFEIADDFEEGIAGVLLPHHRSPVMLAEQDDYGKTFEDVMGRMDNLIGLTDIKKQVRDHAQYIQFLQLRKDKGFEEKEEINVHSVFMGNPGTGKTTVAKMMGRLYEKMGLLSKGHVHEVDRVDLVGEYIGQTAPKVKEAIEKARGGVLFIDEAYSLARSNDDSKDFGREVVEILVKEMSNGKGDIAIIVAGYPKEMQHFMDSNPGLKSRFKIYFDFSDYLPQELSQIAKYVSRDKGVKFTLEAKEKVNELIIDAFRNRDKTFGNARFVNDLVEQAKINLGLRIMESSNPRGLDVEDLSVIEFQDVASIKIDKKKEIPYIPVDKNLLEEALVELNSLIGMDAIKVQIKEMVQLVKYFRETGKDVLNSFSLHTVFVGNPGTGKTTVARILTKIYKSLGILERGQMIETDRQGLVAGFVGQTAIKTAEKIDEAMGGVLFIDEAYALTQKTGGAHGDFGDESVQTILKRMEDNRGEFFIFAAGYPDNMETFLKANPGLNSRFDKILKFEDYAPKDLTKIAKLMLQEQGVLVTQNAEEFLDKYLGFLYEYRDKYFGNAREVRKVVTEAIKNMNLRLAEIPEADRKLDEESVLIVEDLQNFKLDTNDFIFNKKRIGFKK